MQFLPLDPPSLGGLFDRLQGKLIFFRLPPQVNGFCCHLVAAVLTGDAAGGDIVTGARAALGAFVGRWGDRFRGFFILRGVNGDPVDF